MPNPGSTAPQVCTQQDTGPAVLLIHSLLSDPQSWRQVAEALTPTLRVIPCTLRGRGPVPRPVRSEEPPTDHVDDLIALANRLSLTQIHLVGHGSGCPIAAGFALRDPLRVCSLTVIDPALPRSEKADSFVQTWHLENLLQWLTLGHGPEVRQAKHASAIQQVVAQQTHARFADSPLSPPDKMEPVWTDMTRLGSLNCPVLAMVGEGAPEESQAMVAALYGQAARFQLLTVPGASRHSPVEAPAAVAGLLAQFLAS